MAASTVHETSAGGVVVRSLAALGILPHGHTREAPRTARPYAVCLISRRRHGHAEWCLPKGHLEPWEDAATAALREVREETGVSAEIIQPIGTIAYRFTKSNEPAQVSKTVTFFLMHAHGDSSLAPDANEVVEVRWMSFDEAIAMATYPSERQILRQAQRLSRV